MEPQVEQQVLEHSLHLAAETDQKVLPVHLLPKAGEQLQLPFHKYHLQMLQEFLLVAQI
jgi:hypothetical protein